jgi:hypothetical protein
MKSHCASAPVPPEPLQPVRHGKIERMNTRRQGVEQQARTKSLFQNPVGDEVTRLIFKDFRDSSRRLLQF